MIRVKTIIRDGKTLRATMASDPASPCIGCALRGTVDCLCETSFELCNIVLDDGENFTEMDDGGKEAALERELEAGAEAAQICGEIGEMVGRGISCVGAIADREIIEKRVNYTVEQWDYVLRRWASLACEKSLVAAEAKAASVNGQWRIVKHTLTREVVDGN